QGAAMVDPRTLLTGYKWIPERIDTATVKTASGQGNITLVEGEAWNPELEGRFFDLVGNAPKNDHEIMVNKQALERLGVAIGDNVTLVQSGDSFKVVGTLEFVKAARNASVVYAMPGSISSVPVALESYSFYGRSSVSRCDFEPTSRFRGPSLPGGLVQPGWLLDYSEPTFGADFLGATGAFAGCSSGWFSVLVWCTSPS
ncbi:MAG: hypothetical protein RL716_1261, partial [Actinomycetota bacterium]